MNLPRPLVLSIIFACKRCHIFFFFGCRLLVRAAAFAAARRLANVTSEAGGLRFYLYSPLAVFFFTPPLAGLVAVFRFWAAQTVATAVAGGSDFTFGFGLAAEAAAGAAAAFGAFKNFGFGLGAAAGSSEKRPVQVAPSLSGTKRYMPLMGPPG